MRPHHQAKKICFLLTAAALGLAGGPSAYATNTWTGASDGNWNNSGNWTAGIPVTGDILAFSGSSQTLTTNNMAAATNGLNFINDGSSGKTAAFTLGGNAVALSTNIFLSGVTNGSLITDVINMNMLMVTGGKITFNGTNRNLTVNGVISDGGSNFTMQLLGSAALKATVTFAGLNSFGGQVNINGGVLAANTISNSGSPCSLGTNSMIRFGNVGSTGTLLYYGSNTAVDHQVQIGNNTAAGSTANDTGGATIEADGGALVFTNANFNVPQTNVIAKQARVLTLQGTNTAVNQIQGIIQDNTVGASGSGSVALTKAGTNTWELAGANTYSSNTTVSAGTLIIVNNNGLGTNSAALTTVSSGGDFAFSNNITFNHPLSIAGTGPSGLAAVESLSGTNTLAANITVTAVADIKADAGLLTIAVPSGDAIDCGNAAAYFRGPGTITVSNVISGAGSFGLGSAGILNLFALNTFSNNTFRIDSGTVVANTLTNQGTACSLGVTNTYIRMGFQSNSVGTLDYVGGTTTSDRQIQIGFDPTSTNTGYTSGATIQNNGTGALQFTNATFNVPVAAAAARTLTLGGANTANSTISGVITDNATGTGGIISLVKTDAGQWDLSGGNTYTGGTTVSNGTLLVDGSLASGTTVQAGILGGSGILTGPVTVNAGGTIAPGDAGIGTLTINNNLTLNAGATVYIEVNKSSATNDVVAGLNNVTYNGSLVVSNVAATALSGGETYQLFNALGTTLGNFSNVTIISTNGLTGTFNPATGVLTVNPAVAIPNTPTNLLMQVSAGNLTLSWPSNYLGWSLQVQTNNLSTGLGTNWVTVPGSSSVISTNFPITQTNPCVFYRMYYHP